MRRRRMSMMALAVLAPFWSCAKDIQIQPPGGSKTAAVFDPASTPPDIPSPNDLLRDLSAGLVTMPGANKATAEGEYRLYLSALDGFPRSSVASFSVAGELALEASPDLSTIVRGFSVDRSDPKRSVTRPVDPKQLSFSYRFDAAKRRSTITVTLEGGWRRKTTYAFVVLGGASGLKDRSQTPVIRSLAFELAAGRRPLCALQNPSVAPGPKNPCLHNYSTLLRRQIEAEVNAAAENAGKTVDARARLVSQKTRIEATRLEAIRVAQDRVLRIADKAQIDRDAIVLAWSFTVAGLSEPRFDPLDGVIPGPANDLRIASADDQKTGCKKGRVCIPAAPGETPGEAAVRLGLGTLDGFSTIAGSWTLINGAVNPASVVRGGMIALNQTDPADRPAFVFSYDTKSQAIVATPKRPLRENTTYAIVGVSKRTLDSAGTVIGKKSASGLGDAEGDRLVASPSFALIRLRHPLTTKDSRSQISSLTDAQATALEPLRRAYQPLFARLEASAIAREDVVIAWTFTTQSITRPLAELRALPWRALETKDGGQPRFSGAEVQTPAALNAVGKSYVASFTSLLGLDERLGTLYPAAERVAKAKTITVPFSLTLPKGKSASTRGWPLAVFFHGFGRGRVDAQKIANRLAKAGFAVAAFDMIYHGARARCRADKECTGAGSCHRRSGACDTTLADADGDGVPDASGNAAFFDLDRPFALRDALRQQVIDAAAFLRAVKLGAEAKLGIALDQQQIHIVGHALGGITGALLLAVDSAPKRGVLNATGAPLVSLLEQSSTFAPLLDALRSARRIEQGSLADRRLLATLQWILDPADPANIAEALTRGSIDDLLQPNVKVSKKAVMVQRATLDRVVPPLLAQRFANGIGVRTTHTIFNNQGHGFLLEADPDPGATVAAQAQVAQFLLDGTICRPDPLAGRCR